EELRQMAHPKKHTFGVRIADHRVAHALGEALGEPIVSSTLLLPEQEDPPTEGRVVHDLLGEQSAAILDSVQLCTQPTTVSYLARDELVIAREGAGDIDRF